MTDIINAEIRNILFFMNSVAKTAMRMTFIIPKGNVTFTHTRNESWNENISYFDYELRILAALTIDHQEYEFSDHSLPEICESH